MDGHDPAAKGHCWYPDDYPGEAPIIAAADADDNFLDGFGNSAEELFKLLWEGDSTRQPGVPSTPTSRPPPELPRVPLEPPPSDDMMATWLYPIVSGEVDHAGDSTKIQTEVKSDPGPAKMATVSLTMSTESKGKLPATEDMSSAKYQNENTVTDPKEREKVASGGSSRTMSSHYSGTHNSIERRRRCKISERLRTLRQLVPGCDKSNQASTLEQTIQYMKSLQQQVQSMNMRPAASAAAAVYPLVQPPMPIPSITTGQVRPGAIVPYGSVIPYAYYHTVAVPVMEPAPETSAAPEGQCSISPEQRRQNKEKGNRRL